MHKTALLPQCVNECSGYRLASPLSHKPSAAEWTEPLLRLSGEDVSHWFDERTGDVRACTMTPTHCSVHCGAGVFEM